jgi:hypothetical protein
MDEPSLTRLVDDHEGGQLEQICRRFPIVGRT